MLLRVIATMMVHVENDIFRSSISFGAFLSAIKKNREIGVSRGFSSGLFENYQRGQRNEDFKGHQGMGKDTLDNNRSK